MLIAFKQLIGESIFSGLWNTTGRLRAVNAKDQKHPKTFHEVIISRSLRCDVWVSNIIILHNR